MSNYMMEGASQPMSGDGNFAISTPSQFLALFARDKNDQHFPAKLIAREHSFYWLRVSEFLREGRSLVLADGRFRFEVEVAVCYPDPCTGYRLGCRVISQQPGCLRQDWRMAVNIPAEMVVASAVHPYRVRIRDSSPFGFGVEAPVALLAGTLVTIRTPDGVGSGEIRHCRAIADGRFFAGVHLREYEAVRTHAAERALQAARRWARRFYVNTLGLASRT